MRSCRRGPSLVLIGGGQNFARIDRAPDRYLCEWRHRPASRRGRRSEGRAAGGHRRLFGPAKVGAVLTPPIDWPRRGIVIGFEGASFEVA